MIGARTALEVADWRRRVFALYDAVRAAASPEDAHELWRIERDELMLRHPATPLLPEARVLFEGLPVAPYDARWRFELPLLDAEPAEFEFATGTDGVVPFERIVPWRFRTRGASTCGGCGPTAAVCSCRCVTPRPGGPEGRTAAAATCSTP